MLSTNIIREADGAYSWGLGDLDLYVPNHKKYDDVPPMIMYLTQFEGYQLNAPYAPKMYSPYEEIKDIVPMTRGSLQIDIIICHGPFTLHPVLQFHSMLVMNCITGSGSWSAYPRPTADGRGVTNHMTHTLDTQSPEPLLANVHAALSKYIIRGFDIHPNPTCWSGDRHACQTYSFCPHALHTIEDDACMFVHLRPIRAAHCLASNLPGNMCGVSADVCKEGTFFQEWHLGMAVITNTRLSVAGSLMFI